MKKYFLLLLFTSSAIFAKEENFHIVTITKSGTHLIRKLLILLGASWKDKTIYHFLDRYKIPYDSSHPAKYIFSIRDPRDVALSFVGHINKYPEWFNGHPFHPVRSSGWPERFEVFGLDLNTWNTFSEDEKLSVVIQNRRYDTQEFSLDGRSLISQWKNYLNLKDKHPHLLVRFEDIIGEKGNGCNKKQKEMILKLVDYLGIETTDEKIAYAQENLFGDTWTFYKGLIGSWKDEFNEQHKRDFKSTYKDILKHLPYDFSDMQVDLVKDARYE